MARPRLPQAYAWVQLSLRALSIGIELVLLVVLIGLSAAYKLNFPVGFVAVFWGLALDISEITALSREPPPPRRRRRRSRSRSQRSSKRIPAVWMFPAELVALALFTAGFCFIIMSYYDKPQDIFTGQMWPSQVHVGQRRVDQWRMGAFALQVAGAVLSLVFLMMSTLSWCTYGKW